jgi:hypothetical protein
LAHCFRGFSPWSDGFIALGLWKYRKLWQKGMAEEKCSPHSSQAVDRDTRKVHRPDISFRDSPPMTYFCQVFITSYLCWKEFTHSIWTLQWFNPLMYVSIFII